MANDKQAEQTLALFRTFLEREQVTHLGMAGPPVGGEGPTEVTNPHPYYLVSGDAVLNGMFTGAQKLAGYQSVVVQGDRAVEAPIAAPYGEEMSYVASWAPETTAALSDALRVAEENGRDARDFAVVTVPEVGFTAVWLRDRHELIPMATTQTRRGLDPTRIYTEEEVIEGLHDQLSERLTGRVRGADAGELEEPPTA